MFLIYLEFNFEVIIYVVVSCFGQTILCWKLWPHIFWVLIFVRQFKQVLLRSQVTVVWLHCEDEHSDSSDYSSGRTGYRVERIWKLRWYVVSRINRSNDPPNSKIELPTWRDFSMSNKQQHWSVVVICWKELSDNWNQATSHRRTTATHIAFEVLSEKQSIVVNWQESTISKYVQILEMVPTHNKLQVTKCETKTRGTKSMLCPKVTCD